MFTMVHGQLEAPVVITSFMTLEPYSLSLTLEIVLTLSLGNRDTEYDIFDGLQIGGGEGRISKTTTINKRNTQPKWLVDLTPPATTIHMAQLGTFLEHVY